METARKQDEPVSIRLNNTTRTQPATTTTITTTTTTFTPTPTAALTTSKEATASSQEEASRPNGIQPRPAENGEAEDVLPRKESITICVGGVTTKFDPGAADPCPRSREALGAGLAGEGWCERYTSCRWVLAYLGSLLTLLVMCLRHCLSMAVVCIASVVPSCDDVTAGGEGGGNASRGSGATESWELSDLAAVNSSSAEGGLAAGVLFNGSSQQTCLGPAYIPEDVEGLVLSSYYYGYILTPLFAGMLAQRFGPKKVITVAMTISATLTLLTPLAIRFNVYVTIASRVLLGLVSGFCVPSVTGMWAHWAPKEEKAKLMVVTFSGSSTGSIMANLVSGFLCSVPVDDGWPFIFYTYGALALVWVILWQLLAYDTPDEHPRIQGKERARIRRRRGSTPATGKVSKPPVRDIFTSPAFLSLLVTHVSYTWFLTTFATYLPIYLNDVLFFDIQTNGVLSSLPFVFRVAAGAVFAVLSDRLTAGGKLTVRSSRRLFQCIGLLVPGGLVVGVGLLSPEMRTAAVVILILAATSQAACLSGFRINHLDIAPRFAGSLAGITVSFATAASIVCPLIISPMVADKRQESWRDVFILTAAVSLVGALVFGIFGQGEEQDWAIERPATEVAVTPVPNVLPLDNVTPVDKLPYIHNVISVANVTSVEKVTHVAS